jgi:hypothetical protein
VNVAYWHLADIQTVLVIGRMARASLDAFIRLIPGNLAADPSANSPCTRTAIADIWRGLGIGDAMLN